MSKKLKEDTSLFGIQKSTKDTKVKHNLFENIANALKSFGRSIKGDDRVARRVIQTMVVSSTTKENLLTNCLAKALGASQKNITQKWKIPVASRCRWWAFLLGNHL